MAPAARGERGVVIAAVMRLLVLGLAVGLAVGLGVSVHAAESPPPQQVASRSVGECLAAGEVWLHIQIETAQVLRSECVGSPANGTEALASADVATTLSSGGYLCTLAGHPEQCPRRFAGQYWQYWHVDSLGTPWTYSQWGADEHEPKPGSIEGWCYNRTGESRCVLPTLSADDVAAPRVDIESESVSTSGWVIGILVVLAVAAAVIVRRKST